MRSTFALNLFRVEPQPRLFERSENKCGAEWVCESLDFEKSPHKCKIWLDHFFQSLYWRSFFPKITPKTVKELQDHFFQSPYWSLYFPKIIPHNCKRTTYWTTFFSALLDSLFFKKSPKSYIHWLDHFFQCFYTLNKLVPQQRLEQGFWKLGCL